MQLKKWSEDSDSDSEDEKESRRKRTKTIRLDSVDKNVVPQSNEQSPQLAENDHASVNSFQNYDKPNINGFK